MCGVWLILQSELARMCIALFVFWRGNGLCLFTLLVRQIGTETLDTSKGGKLCWIISVPERLSDISARVLVLYKNKNYRLF